VILSVALGNESNYVVTVDASAFADVVMAYKQATTTTGRENEGSDGFEEDRYELLGVALSKEEMIAVTSGAGSVVFLCVACMFCLGCYKLVCRSKRRAKGKAADPDAPWSHAGVAPSSLKDSEPASPAGKGHAQQPPSANAANASPAAASAGGQSAPRMVPTGTLTNADASPNDFGWSVCLILQGSKEWDALAKMLIIDAEDAPHMGGQHELREKWGRDVREPGRYRQLQPVAMWRIDARLRQEKYRLEREEVRQKLNLVKRQRGLSFLPPLCTKLDAVASTMEMDLSVSERLLWHGTTSDLIMAILQNGMNERFSDGHFGKGLYLAEDAAKMDQYVTSDRAGDPNFANLHDALFTANGLEHPGKLYYGLACRSLLGFSVFTKDGQESSDSNEALKRSPAGIPVFSGSDQRELAAIPEVKPLTPFQSMVVENGAKESGYALARHREFVVMHAAQILPEYIVAYRRV